MENTHIPPSRCQWLHVECINNAVLRWKKGNVRVGGHTGTSASGDLWGRLKVSECFHPFNFKFYSEMIRSALSDLFPVNGCSHPTILLEFIKKVTRGLNTKCRVRRRSSITFLQKRGSISHHQSSVNTHKSFQLLNTKLFFFLFKQWNICTLTAFPSPPASWRAGGDIKLEEEFMSWGNNDGKWRKFF